MQAKTADVIPATLKKHESDLLDEWMREQLAAVTLRRDLIDEGELRKQSKEFIGLLARATQGGNVTDMHESGDWAAIRDFLSDISRKRSAQGFSPAETATFILSFKQPLVARLRQDLDAGTFADASWSATYCSTSSACTRWRCTSRRARRSSSASRTRCSSSRRRL